MKVKIFSAPTAEAAIPFSKMLGHTGPSMFGIVFSVIGGSTSIERRTRNELQKVL